MFSGYYQRMRTHHEVETKYDVGEELPLPSLEGLPGVAGVSATEHRMEAAYFDTADRRLAAQRTTLRRRTGGSDDGWHLKLPAGSGRHEVHLPLGRARVNPPRRLRDALRTTTGDQPLSAVATLRTHRVAYRLTDDTGDVLAEVADDRVQAELEGRALAWREWEVELLAGDDRLAAAAEDLLRRAGAEPSAWASKLARALGPLPPEGSPTAYVPADPVRVLVLARLAEQVGELRRRDPFVRLGLPEGVHKMRVAVRRLRSALATYRPLLDRERSEPIRDELRWLGGELGAARDAEVLRARLRARMGQVGDSLRGEVAWEDARETIGADLAGREERAREAALAALDSRRYSALLTALDQLLADPGWTDRADGSVEDMARRRARRELKRLRRRMVAAEEAGPADRPGLLHEARKAGKRARYAVEPLVPVYGKPARRLVRRLEKLQSELGDHHDSVAARDHLHTLAATPAATPGGVLVLGILYDREHTPAADVEERAGGAWARVEEKKWRRWLRKGS